MTGSQRADGAFIIHTSCSSHTFVLNMRGLVQFQLCSKQNWFHAVGLRANETLIRVGDDSLYVV